MSSSELLNKLIVINKLVKADVPDVNYGGCGYYATLIQARLAELGYATETGAIAYYGPPYGADHIFTVIRIGDTEYFHDGEETKTMRDFSTKDVVHYQRTQRLPSGETLTIVNSNRWNTWFTPDESVPVLCGIIELVLGPFINRPHFDTIQGVKV